MSATSGLPRKSAEILASIGQHRVLTTEQVRRLHLPGRSSRRAQQLLAHLWAAGLIERVQAPVDLPRFSPCALPIERDDQVQLRIEALHTRQIQVQQFAG